MLGVALAAIALGAVTAAPASAAPEGNKIIEIRSAADGLCLDLGKPETHRAAVSACDGSAAQQFERVPAVAGGSYLRNIGSGTCLDGYNSSVTAWTCETAEAGQRFQEVADADGTVKLTVAGRFGTRFVDSYLFSLFNEVSMFEASTRPTQRWLVREVGVVPPPQPGAPVKLRQAQEGTCVSDSVEFINELRACDAAPAFERIDAGGGKVALRSQASGNCLTVMPKPSLAVKLESCDLSRLAQQWSLVGDELGNHTIVNGADLLTSDTRGHVLVFEPFETSLLQRWQLPAA
ncbi:hypothetical protein GCM10011609_11700 [Lentzea pudingi]|uniref:Ricin B lectin domain-containing protein n=2 Tax=Lentzea pudingi TaxID=1789439 RepID=A0ABQ2HF37_9PSEU|nr:hypothetical protein GCM10011609_11700 [Lentzea pudingi]